MTAALDAYRQGRLDDAARMGARWLAARPADTEAMLFTGVVATKRGCLDEAVGILTQTAGRDPSCREAHYWLSVALRRQSNPLGALKAAQMAVTLNPEDPQARRQLGLCLMDVQDWSSAEIHLRQALKLAPEVAPSHFNLGYVLEELGRIDEAVSAYRRAVALDPKHTQAMCQLGRRLANDLDFEGAVTCANRVLAVDPLSPAGHSLMATALVGLNRPGEVFLHADKALQAEPDKPSSLTLCGVVLRALGRNDEADECFRRSIAIDPLEGYAFYGLVRARKVTTSDLPIVQQMVQVLQDPALPRRRRRDVEFALGKARSDLGDYESAMGHFDAANRMARELRFGQIPFDAKTYGERTDFAIRSFDRLFVEKYASAGSPDPLPIWIVGMMRSGTTLAEQILSCQPEIGAAGEQRFWMDHCASIFERPGNVIDANRFQNVVGMYLALLARLAPGKRRVIDKMPGNFLHLGPLHVAFPNARIIHMRRHPIDTCLSIWTTNQPTSVEWAHGKEEIVFAYREYLRLMAHWRELLPADRLLEVDYEELVNSPQPMIRRMVEFCGMDWDDRCLRPEENTRAVATPSDWQVRQPIYNHAVERWRLFEPWLGDFAGLVE
jgi:tetratricopeptide (TPR) repeat protein